MNGNFNKRVPQILTKLRKDFVKSPEIIKNSTGININGKRIKSLIFTTDISIILNNNADAIMAVYPFSPHPAVVSAISAASSIPVMAGVGGGTTHGTRSANMALFAESNGCQAVVVNSPTPLETIRIIDDYVDIPIIMTIVSEYTEIEEKIDAGIDILNISGASNTAKIVKEIRKRHPDIPIIATGGPTEGSIQETIDAGANAITFTPPTNGELFREKMLKYRENEKEAYYNET